MLGVRHIPPVSIQHAADSFSGHTPDHHVIATKHQLSRVVLKFQNLSPDVWSEFSFEIDWHPQEKARHAQDFASVGITFLTEDGSNIEFPFVPGLIRAQVDPYNTFIAGPAFYDRNVSPSGTCRVQCTFLVPAPARQVLIAVRSWRNSHPFQVGNPRLRQFAQHKGTDGEESDKPLIPSQAEKEAAERLRKSWRALSTEPMWLHYALVPAQRLLIRGQLVTEEADKEGAQVRVIYKDASGRRINPPYPDTLTVRGTGAFINIPTLTQARRFTLDLTPPPHARAVELGFQAKSGGAAMYLAMPLEVSLEDHLLLERISSETTPQASSFIESVSRHLRIPSADFIPFPLNRKALLEAPRFQERLRRVQFGERHSSNLKSLKFGAFPAWPLPKEPLWTEDPYRSPAWRMEYQALSWLAEAAKDSDEELSRQAVALALSWSRANPWGQPADALSLHPLSLAMRAEALLDILTVATDGMEESAAESTFSLLEETIRHGFALSEIVGQNVLSRSIHQVRAAGSLLSLARALPQCALSGFWETIALARLRDGFNELIASDGAIMEGALHGRLEAISYGLILCTVLEKTKMGQELRQDLAPRLKQALVALLPLTDSKGMLPAFGDVPHDAHHAPWIIRLISQYGQGWAADDRVRSALFPTHGTHISNFPQAGIFAIRDHSAGKVTSYFCANIGGRQQSQDHADCTSFIYTGQSESWITDSGGSSQHESGVARYYLTASRAHNIAVPDGREPTPGIAWLNRYLRLPNAQVIDVVTNVHGPDYTHRRMFVLMDDLSAIAVYDHFTTSRGAMSFDGFLHFEPEVVVALASPNLALCYREQKRLRIVPTSVAGRLHGLDIVQGRQGHSLSFQGFVSRTNGSLEPASVLRYTFGGTNTVCGGVILAANEDGVRAINAVFNAPTIRGMLA